MVKSIKSDELAANSSKMLIRSPGAVKIVTISLGRDWGDGPWHFEGNWIRKIRS